MKLPSLPQKVKVMVSSEGHKPIKHHADGRGYPHYYKETFYLDRGDPNLKGKAVNQAFLPLLVRNGKNQTTGKLLLLRILEPPIEGRL